MRSPLKSFMTFLFFIVAINFTAAAFAETLSGDEVDFLLTKLEHELGSRIVMGDSISIQGYRIIPVIKFQVSKGNISFNALDGGDAWGTGGIAQPIGFIVISAKGIDFMPVPRNFGEHILDILNVFLANYAPDGEEKQEISSRHIVEAVFKTLSMMPGEILGVGMVVWNVQKAFFILAWILCAISLYLFAPVRISGGALYVRTHPFISFAAGTCAFLVLLLLSFLAFISFVGLPLALLIFLFSWIGMLFGTSAISLLIGNMVTSRFSSVHRDGLALVIGGGLLSVIWFIPMAGFFIWLLTGLAGFGGFLRSILNININQEG